MNDRHGEPEDKELQSVDVVVVLDFVCHLFIPYVDVFQGCLRRRRPVAPADVVNIAESVDLKANVHQRREKNVGDEGAGVGN